jgi:hypothetical protein
MQGEERCGKTAATYGKAGKTFVKIAATSARIARTFRVIDKISGRMFSQERARNRLRKIGETFAKIGRNFGKIIGISGTIAKTGVETGETYGTTWLAAKATIAKHSDRQEKPATTAVVAGFVLSRNYSIQVFRLTTCTIRHIRPSSSSITSAQVEIEGRVETGTPRFVAIPSSRP